MGCLATQRKLKRKSFMERGAATAAPSFLSLSFPTPIVTLALCRQKLFLNMLRQTLERLFQLFKAYFVLCISHSLVHRRHKFLTRSYSKVSFSSLSRASKPFIAVALRFSISDTVTPLMPFTEPNSPFRIRALSPSLPVSEAAYLAA